MLADKPGRSLELAVAELQRLIDPNSSVTHDEKILDHLGNERQFDVVVRGNLGGRPVLCVIECKDWSDKVGIPEVEAFATKATSVNAHLVLMVSRKGFYEPGMKLAKFKGIGTLSLIPNGTDDDELTIGTRWYARTFRWTDTNFGVILAPGKPVPVNCDPWKVLLDGRPVVEWFLKELETTFSDMKAEGPFRVEHQFQVPQVIDFDGHPGEVKGFFVIATRVRQNRSKFVRAKGFGYYDWQANRVEMPPDHGISFEVTKDGFRDWEPYNGEIDDDLLKPSPATRPGAVGLTMCFGINYPTIDPDKDVVDLTKY